MTDVASGWTECFALLQRSAKGVVVAIQHIQKILPFPILGIDTDNGTEFINADLVEFCKLEQITFTRGRVHRKNDQCFVEQKNGSIVRQVVGYDRYDGLTALRQLSELYRALRLYVNFYQPSMKLKAKSRDGAKVSRTYFPTQTPLQKSLLALHWQNLPSSLKPSFANLLTTMPTATNTAGCPLAIRQSGCSGRSRSSN